MEYLASARGPLGNPLYDPQAALRLARQHKQQRACVELLWELGLFEVRPSLLGWVVRCISRLQLLEGGSAAA